MGFEELTDQLMTHDLSGGGNYFTLLVAGVVLGRGRERPPVCSYQTVDLVIWVTVDISNHFCVIVVVLWFQKRKKVGDRIKFCFSSGRVELDVDCRRDRWSFSGVGARSE